MSTMPSMPATHTPRAPIPGLRRANPSPDIAGVVTGYLALWGSPDETDCYGTYFDRANPPRFGFMYEGDRLAPIRLMYEHGQDKTIGKTVLGRITRVWKDDSGIAFEAMLDRAELDPAIFARVVGELQRGELGVSSASAEHLVDFEEDGRFKNWLLSEVSLTAWPCERRMPSAMVRSMPPNTPPDQSDQNQPNLSQRQEGETVHSPDTPQAQETPNGNPAIRVADCGCGAGDQGQPVLQGDALLVPVPVSVSDPISEQHPQRRGATPMTTKNTAKRALTLETLGLQPTATIDEVVAALVDMLGEDAAAAMLKKFVGGDKPAAPAADGEGEMSGMPVDERLRSLFKAAKPEQKPDPLAEMRAKMDKLEAALNAPAPEPTRAAPGGSPVPALSVQVNAPRRFDGKSAADLAFAYLTLRAKGVQPSEELTRVMAGRLVDGVERGDKALTQPEVMRAMPATRANEIMTSTASGAGDEWVSIAWSTNAWEKARYTLIMDALTSLGMRIEEIPQGAESLYILGDGADPTVYSIAQNADVDATSRPTVTIGPSRPGTTRHLLTPGTIAARVIYTQVFAEDSLLNVASQLNAQMSITMQEHIEKLLLNGDSATGANTNINLIDGTPGTGLSTPYYLASDGILKLPLVTTTSLSRDGGTLDDVDFRETLKLLPGEIRTRFPNLAFVVDPDTHSASLGMLAVKTESERAQLATINSGMLRNIYGVDVLVSGMMGLANTAGKISGTGSNNTKGRILAVYAPYWTMGWKRQITLETARDIEAQANIIVATARLGFQYRSATGAAALTYNVTV